MLTDAIHRPVEELLTSDCPEGMAEEQKVWHCTQKSHRLHVPGVKFEAAVTSAWSAGPLADLVRKEDRVGKEGQPGYSWQASDSPTFFPGRHADVLYKGAKVRHSLTSEGCPEEHNI